MATEQQHFEASRRWQEYLQREVGDEVGLRIPAPVLGQVTYDYVREQMRTLKRTFLPQNHDLYRVNMRGLSNDAVQPMMETLIPACKVEAFNPLTVPRGEFREVVKTDANGLKTRNFVGQESFVVQMMRPGRRAKFRQLSIHDYK
jgi:hypothetical protein